ncbi:MAG TPA: HD domain-containing protein [Acidobacteriota bacterium]|jgi:3'-5' exoribonuclease
MNRKFIRDFELSDVVITFALLRGVQKRTRRTGEEFLALELQDRTGSIGGKIWDLEESMSELRSGDYVKVKARVEEYHGVLQLSIEKIRKVVESDREHGFQETDCVISTPCDIDEMWRKLQTLVDQEISDALVKQLVKNVLARTEGRFKYYPAAQEIHHGYRGGFLEHVLSVTQNCAYFAGHYPEADKNLLVAGGLLHDIGKLEELTPAPAVEYTVPGRLVGHIILGRDLVREEAAKIPNFPEETLLLIEHLILSHQGDYDWGSPKRPKILEALILHYLDDLDAKVNHLQGVLQAHRGPSLFTGYDRILGRVLYKRQPLPGAEEIRAEIGEAPGESGEILIESEEILVESEEIHVESEKTLTESKKTITESEKTLFDNIDIRKP